MATSYETISPSDYGGTPGPTWVANGFEFPGYHNAVLSISDKRTGDEVIELPFKISPSSFAEARSKLYQLVKTMGGWLVQKLGNNPIEVNLSGYMLDIKSTPERQDFLDNYEKYIDDQKNYSSDYYNPYYTKLVVEGREYYGIVAGLNFQKSANNPFIYSYNLSFVALGQKRIYNTNNASSDAEVLATQAVNDQIAPNMFLSQNIAASLDSSLAQTEGTKDKLSAPVNTEEQSIINYADVKTSQSLTETEKLNKAEITVIESVPKGTPIIKSGDTNFAMIAFDVAETEGDISVPDVPIPQEVYQQLNGIKWYVAQILALDKEHGYLSPNYKQQYPYEYTYENLLQDRHVYLAHIDTACNTLIRNLKDVVSKHHMHNDANEIKNVYHYFERMLNHPLEDILEMKKTEHQNPITRYNEKDYRITKMEKKINSVFSFITTKK